MGLLAAYLQTGCRLIELALSAYALWYFADRGRPEWLWTSAAVALLGPLVSGATAATALLRGSAGAASAAAAGARPQLAGFVLAHGLLCGDLWWFYMLAIRGGGWASRRQDVYSLSRLATAALTSVPLSLIAATAYGSTLDWAPGLCALASAAAATVTWGFHHDYGSTPVQARARRGLLRALAVAAKGSVALSRLPALARVAGSPLGVWIVPPLLLARLAAAAAWLALRNRRRTGAGDRSWTGAGHRRSWTARAVTAAAYSTDLLLSPAECSLSLIAAYYAVALLENCALALAWYAAVDPATATRARLLWLACDFAALSLGILLTVVHQSLANAAAAAAAAAGRKNGKLAGDVTPAADDYEWDPYDGDIRRRPSYANATPEVERRQAPPLAIVLPYSELPLGGTPGVLALTQPSGAAKDGSLDDGGDDDAAAEAPPERREEAVAGGGDDSGAPTRSRSASASSGSGGSPPRCPAADAPGRHGGDGMKPAAAADDRCRPGHPDSVATATARSAPPQRPRSADERRAATGAASDKQDPSELSATGWGLEHNVAYLNCGFVADDGADADALPPARYLPHAPRGVFTTRWHSASYGLTSGRRAEALTHQTLPNLWRGSPDGLPERASRGDLRGREAPQLARQPTAAAAAAAEIGGAAAAEPAMSKSAEGPRLPAAQLDGRAAASRSSASSTLDRSVAAHADNQQHWVRRWLQQVVSPSKTQAATAAAAAGSDAGRSPDTFF